jgi:hypothetical protein
VLLLITSGDRSVCRLLAAWTVTAIPSAVFGACVSCSSGSELAPSEPEAGLCDGEEEGEDDDVGEGSAAGQAASASEGGAPASMLLEPPFTGAAGSTAVISPVATSVTLVTVTSDGLMRPSAIHATALRKAAPAPPDVRVSVSAPGPLKPVVNEMTSGWSREPPAPGVCVGNGVGSVTACSSDVAEAEPARDTEAMDTEAVGDGEAAVAPPESEGPSDAPAPAPAGEAEAETPAP